MRSNTPMAGISTMAKAWSRFSRSSPCPSDVGKHCRSQPIYPWATFYRRDLGHTLAQKLFLPFSSINLGVVAISSCINFGKCSTKPSSSNVSNIDLCTPWNLLCLKMVLISFSSIAHFARSSAIGRADILTTNSLLEHKRVLTITQIRDHPPPMRAMELH